MSSFVNVNVSFLTKITYLLLLFHVIQSNDQSNLNPIKISYKTYLPTTGIDESLSPIILIHGLIATKEEWDNIAPAIADITHRKVFAYDARNHGDSEFTEEFHHDAIVDDLFYFMDAMAIGKAVLIGHSMGGKIAIAAALREPERIEVMISEEMGVRKTSSAMIERILMFVQGFSVIASYVPSHLNISEGVKFLLDLMFSFAPEDSIPEREKESLYRTKFILKSKPDGEYDVSFNKAVILDALRNADELMKEAEGQYNGTSAFIYGGLSNFNVGYEKEYIKQHFPNAIFVEFENAYHNLHVEFPTKYVETIANILQ